MLTALDIQRSEPADWQDHSHWRPLSGYRLALVRAVEPERDSAPASCELWRLEPSEAQTCVVPLPPSG